MRFPGIIPAVVTPFRADDTIDLAALQSNVEALVAAGVHGLVATGTMGESASLDRDERRTVISAVTEVVAGRIPVLCGIATPTAKQAIGYAQDAREAGVDGLMVLPPLNYAGDPNEIELYYRSIGERAGLPIMAYNNPAASGVELGTGVIARLAGEVQSVVAVKECSGDARNIASIIGATGDDFEVLVGGDDFALEGFCAGATGWVSGVANVVPADCVRLYEACLVGALTDARSLYQRMLPLARLDMTPKLVQYFKRAMDQAGFVGGLCRAPRLPLTDAEEDRLAHAMQMLQAQPVS